MRQYLLIVVSEYTEYISWYHLSMSTDIIYFICLVKYWLETPMVLDASTWKVPGQAHNTKATGTFPEGWSQLLSHSSFVPAAVLPLDHSRITPTLPSPPGNVAEGLRAVVLGQTSWVYIPTLPSHLCSFRWSLVPQFPHLSNGVKWVNIGKALRWVYGRLTEGCEGNQNMSPEICLSDIKITLNWKQLKSSECREGSPFSVQRQDINFHLTGDRLLLAQRQHQGTLKINLNS